MNEKNTDYESIGVMTNDYTTQYQNELNQRYLRYLQSASVATDAALDMLGSKVSRRSKQRKAADANDVNGDKGESATLMMNRSLAPKYKVQTVIIDSAHRNAALYPNANDFVVKLVEPLKQVVAIRVMKTEYFQPCNSVGYFVMNGARIPLQVYNLDHAYLYLNGYINTLVANEVNLPTFGRIGPGTEVYPSVTGDITQDPYIYVMRPAEPKLKRFHVRLLTHDGQLYAVDNPRIILTLAVYCFA